MKCDRPFQLNIHNILKVNPKCANSGHFKLTIDGLLGAITQTMEVGWGDSEDCVLAVQSWQRLITDIIIITRLNIWMLSLLSQYGSGGGQWPVCGKRPHLTGLPLNIADCRLSQISAAEIQLAYLSISVWNRRYGGPMSDVTTIFLQLKVTLWFLCLFIVMSNVGERCSSMLHWEEEDNTGGAMRSVQYNQSIQITIAKYKPLNPWCCMELSQAGLLSSS